MGDRHPDSGGRGEADPVDRTVRRADVGDTVGGRVDDDDLDLIDETGSHRRGLTRQLFKGMGESRLVLANDNY